MSPEPRASEGLVNRDSFFDGGEFLSYTVLKDNATIANLVHNLHVMAGNQHRAVLAPFE